MTIKFSRHAQKEFDGVGSYISQQGYPETAIKYGKRMFDFCNSLSNMPDKYPLCRHIRFSRWQFRCATFEDTYIIIYKIETKYIVIKRIIHGKQLI